MKVEILNLGVTPACLKCGCTMSAVAQLQVGDRNAVVVCNTPECLDNGVKYRITLPVLIGEKVQ